MRTIPLSRGYEAIVDDEDYERLSQYRWYAKPSGRGGKYVYAIISCSEQSPLFRTAMHRFITDCPADLVVDHKNGNTLDNRRENLRVCRKQENCWNMRNARRGRFRGLGWKKSHRAWEARIRVDGRLFHLGYFDDPLDAAAAYNRAAAAHFGEFAVLNDLSGGSHG